MAERFAKDTAHHAMQVHHDDDLYRHVAFRNPESSSYWFDLVTSPGLLTITGDMGTFVFARIRDMFEFFDGPSINPSYWVQKVLAADRYCRVERYSRAVFEEAVEDHIVDWLESYAPTVENDLADSDDPDDVAELESQRQAYRTYEATLREAVNDRVLGGEVDLDDERSARAALEDFGSVTECDDFGFFDVWEWDFEQYSALYLWCCYAIVWGIEQYKASKRLPTIDVEDLANELWSRLPDDRGDADASDLAEGLRDVLKRWQDEGLPVEVAE